jgi:hypothetical protein
MYIRSRTAAPQKRIQKASHAEVMSRYMALINRQVPRPLAGSRP